MMNIERLIAIGISIASSTAFAQVPRLGDFVKKPTSPSQPAVGAPTAPTAPAPDQKTSALGIQEALAVGTENAVKRLSQVNGYFGNEAVRIPLPPNIQKLADVARKMGLQQPVDDLVLRLNRAAEAAAPVAARHFGDAIRAMTFDDARGILTGGDTAATEFFRRKTRDKIYAAFKPIVSQKVGEAGAARAYKDVIGRLDALPLASRQPFDLDDYVSNKSLDGLYYMVAQEEKRIRSNPLARTTELLRAVFGR